MRSQFQMFVAGSGGACFGSPKQARTHTVSGAQWAAQFSEKVYRKTEG